MRTLKRILSSFTALVLVCAMLPLSPVLAAGGDIQFTHYSTEPDHPTYVSTKNINVEGTFYGISFSSLKIKVESILNENAPPVPITDNDGLVPLQIGNNGFRFANVVLHPGKNKITVYGYASGSSDVIEKSAYVYYANAPSISDIRLQDNRVVRADRPTLVTTPTLTLMFKAPNATSVTVQGVEALRGGDDTYLVSGIQLSAGLNRISFVARNETQTYSITRDIVLYNNRPTAAGVAIVNPAGNPRETALDGRPTVGPNDQANNRLTGYASGYLFMEKEGNQLPKVELALQQYSESGGYLPENPAYKTASVSLVEQISVTGAVYDFVMYRFQTPTGTGDYFQINSSGTHVLNIRVNDEPAQQLMFNYRSGNSPIIDEVLQAHNVRQLSGNQYAVGSVTSLTDNQIFYETPIWIAVKARNFDPKTDKASLKLFVNGNEVGAPAFQYENSSGGNYYFVTPDAPDGVLLFKINHLPSGEQTLRIIVEKTEADTKDIDLTFNPTPFIEITSHYDGQVFEKAESPVIRGKLYNFNLSANSPDRESLQLTFNGISAKITNIDAATSTFEFDTSAVTGMQLVLGTNTITVSGTAGGIPVSTTITLFLFDTDKPTIISMIPVPEGEDGDADNQIPSVGTDQYSTNLRRVDVLFEISDADSITVSTDGVRNNIIRKQQNGGNYYWDAVRDNENPLDVTVPAIGATRQIFRIHAIPLPETGAKSVTIAVAKGVSTVYRTITIERVRQPYVLLSPKLPEEQVINRNFLKVSIQAEGADRVLLGKQEMVKGEEDIFRLDYYDLKPGKNTIKFTVITADNEVDGQFTVTYAAKPEVGAEYKTTIPKSGKLNNLFEGSLTIDFGKNTMLRQPVDKDQSNVPQIELFDSQYIYIGIADPKDGRTVKRYNQVGEIVNGKPADGRMADVYPNDYARGALMRGIENFGYASPLYWIDAGYFVQTSGKYETVDGMHPYARNDEFYVRVLQPSKWMEPTARGTITIKYDPSIRNEAAKLLSVWKFSNNTWRNIGGVVNTGRKTITATFDGFGYYAVFMLRYDHPDIIGSYARDHAETMYAKGIMYPKPNSSVFGLNEPITRGEFATMLVRILDLPLNYSNSLQENSFDDVPIGYVSGTLWDYRYIETAARAGIIRGIGTRSFAPNVNLTREQAAIMIARALNLKLSEDVDKDRNSLSKVFVDAGQIDQHAVTSVQAIYKKGFIQGRPVTMEEGQKKQLYAFNPKANLSRAEMAVIAYKIMKDLKKL